MWQVIRSVLAAFFGVQSEQNRQQDFSRSSPWPFIITGVLAGAVFVLLVLGLAHLAAG